MTGSLLTIQLNSGLRGRIVSDETGVTSRKRKFMDVNDELTNKGKGFLCFSVALY